MRGHLACVAALVLAGCVTDHAVALVIAPPRTPEGAPDVPVDSVAWEIRLHRLEAGDACPTLTAALAARPNGRLASAQSFAIDERGMEIGEVPSGRWAFSAIARRTDCTPTLFGCVEVELDAMIPAEIVVDVVPVTATETCGACRSCETGACTPINTTCE